MSACHIFHIVTHVDWSAYCDEAVKRSQDERSRHEAGPHYQLVTCNTGAVDDTVLVLVASDNSSDVSSGSDE